MPSEYRLRAALRKGYPKFPMSVIEASHYFNVSAAQIRRWCMNGWLIHDRLPACQTNILGVKDRVISAVIEDLPPLPCNQVYARTKAEYELMRNVINLYRSGAPVWNPVSELECIYEAKRYLESVGVKVMSETGYLRGMAWLSFPDHKRSICVDMRQLVGYAVARGFIPPIVKARKSAVNWVRYRRPDRRSRKKVTDA